VTLIVGGGTVTVAVQRSAVLSPQTLRIEAELGAGARAHLNTDRGGAAAIGATQSPPKVASAIVEQEIAAPLEETTWNLTVAAPSDPQLKCLTSLHSMTSSLPGAVPSRPRRRSGPSRRRGRGHPTTAPPGWRSARSGMGAWEAVGKAAAEIHVPVATDETGC